MPSTIEYSPDDDSYAILGVSEYSDEKKVKKAYILLARQFHPDKWPMHARREAHEDFVRIQNAYDILGDSKTRRKYQRKRKEHFRDLYPSRSFFIFEDGMKTEEAKLKKKEIGWKRKLGALWKKRKTEQDEARANEEKQRKRQWEDEKRPTADRNDAKYHHRSDDDFTKELLELKYERQSVAMDLQAWEKRQKEKRQVEVLEREAQMSTLQQKQECARNELQERQKQALENLRKAQARDREAQIKKQEKERDILRASQETQRVFQRDGRKRVREECDHWFKETDRDVKQMEAGLSRRHIKRKRPEFYRTVPMYGTKQNGTPCNKCKHAGGFCHHHRNQKS